ncbi:unnamed protein product [Zymoseptoria tritici ST99CH_3D7]|uniref:Uncharacterized protein n=1 Tax=Zymoseptoria tritici (strain ST99CH_3D7) TaxID=1276538 RepID=A0A1X7SAG9_ZYMT9|nr:unnamed protein product [Zymoseptoria tritici ST99CH_3D7]
MTIQGKIIVPLDWCHSFSIDSYHHKLGYAIINDPTSSSSASPQLLDSKLYYPILANLTIGYYAGQASAKDGCPSKLNWNDAPDVAAAIRAWAKKYGVAKECSPLPSQLRALVTTLRIPLQFGQAVVHDVLLRVLRFVYAHVSDPKLAAVGQGRAGQLTTVNHTVALLAREGVFDYSRSSFSSSSSTGPATTTAAAEVATVSRLVTPPPEGSVMNDGEEEEDEEYTPFVSSVSSEDVSDEEEAPAPPRHTTTTTTAAASKKMKPSAPAHSTTAPPLSPPTPTPPFTYSEIQKLLALIIQSVQQDRQYLHAYGDLINKNEAELEHHDSRLYYVEKHHGQRLNNVEKSATYLGESVSELRNGMTGRG